MNAAFIRFVSPILFLATGCAYSPPPANQPLPSRDVTAQSKPLRLALRAPQTIENDQVAQYLTSLPAARVAQGVWMQSETQLLANHQGTIPLPAASLTKIATSLAALETFGPNHQFTTRVKALGTIEDGILQGDLEIEGGADPLFVWESAIALGNDLKQQGIERITGNLIISGRFYMNFKTDPQQTGRLLKQGLNANLWPAEAATQYQTLKNVPKPQIEIQGEIQVAHSGAATRELSPQGSSTLLTVNSLPLSELLKQMNRYSNNAMADMLAQEVGGAQRVATLAAQLAGVPQTEVQLINGSGLGVANRMSPRAACGMLIAIAKRLHPQQTIADVLAVTGQDVGILNPRPLPENAVIKSGTLNTVSALAGAMTTERHDVVWFAIINGKGKPQRFRTQQEMLLYNLLERWGTASEISPLLKKSHHIPQKNGNSIQNNPYFHSG